MGGRRGFYSNLLTDSDYLARWKAKCDIKPNGCWVWLGFKFMGRGVTDPFKGYAAASYRGKNGRLGRYIVAMKIGRPLEKYEVACHHCDNPPCINPDHLFCGTQKENGLDARAKKRYWYQRITKCKRGHEFDEENTQRDSRGFRHCRACLRYLARLRAGWSEEEALAIEKIPAGVKTERRTYMRAPRTGGSP